MSGFRLGISRDVLDARGEPSPSPCCAAPCDTLRGCGGGSGLPGGGNDDENADAGGCGLPKDAESGVPA